MGLSTGYLAPLASAAGACPSAMSRAAVIALRDSNSLSVDCHYVVNDHVQGRLVAGTTVLLHATSTNETSQVAQVNTTYDNEAWFGLYDIDQAQLIHLRDNRGNEVDGAAQIAAFDWGNTSYTNVKVLDGGVLTATIGSTAVKRTVTVSGASVLNITNFNGTLEESEISESAQVNLSNTSLLFTGNTITDGAQFLAQGLTVVGGVVQRCVARNSAVTLSGAGAPTITNTDFLSSTVTHNSGATVTWAGCEFASGAVVSHTGAGAQSLTRCYVNTEGQIAHSSGGAVTGVNCYVEQLAQWECSGTTSLINATNHTCSGSTSALRATLTGRITLTRGRVEDGGIVRTDSGAITTTDQTVRGVVEVIAPATLASTITVTGGSVEKTAKITNSGAGGVVILDRVDCTHRMQTGAPSHIVVSNGGTLNIRDSTIDAAQVNLRLNGTTLTGVRLRMFGEAIVDQQDGTLTATDLTMDTAATLNLAGAIPVTVNRANLKNSAACRTFAGTGGALFVEGVDMERGLITKTATSTAGNLRVGQLASFALTTRVDAGTISMTGTASNCLIAGGVVGRGCAVNFNGTRDALFYYNELQNTTTVNCTGTGGVAGTVLDRMFESTLERTTVNFASSGAAVNSLEALNAVSNSTFNINGTTANQRWLRFKMGAFSTCTFTDCTATMIHTNTTVLDASTVTFTNVAVAKWIEDCQVVSGSVLTVTAPTAAGLVNRLTIQSRGTITVTGPVGTVSRSTAMAGGILNFTGGAAHANVTASMSGALTMPFDTGNVYHNTNVNTTTTAANTNRGRDFFNNNIV